MKVSLLRHIHPYWLALLVTLPLGAETATLETVQKSAGEWLKVRAETARLDTEWTTQRELLDSMAHGLAERAQTIEARRDYLRSKGAKDREDIASLEASNKTTSAGLQSLDEQLKAMSVRLLQLRPSLPPRLSTALELAYKSLATPEPTLGERMQLTMMVLNRCMQFNRSIICEDELLKLTSDGSARQLEVIYWGLSQGYALDRAGGKVWLGSPGASGWQWEPVPDPSALGRVARLISIYHGKEEPAFVELPASLRQPAVASLKK